MRTKLVAVFFLAGVLLASCGNKDNPPAPEGNGIKVTLPTTGPLSIYKWKAADALRIGDKVFTVTAGAGTATATLSGTPDKENYYNISYPASITNQDSYLAYSFVGQMQNGNGSVEHLLPTVYIEDVNSAEDITLSKQWASSKGGSFRTNGVLSFNLTLPADAGAIQSISIESLLVKFPTTNSGSETADDLTLTLNNVSAASGPVKAYLSVSEKAVNIDAEFGVKITVIGDKSYYTTVEQSLKLGGGLAAELTVPNATVWTGFTPVKGKGTEANPYILSSAQNLEAMSGLLKEDETVWFELGADIDMKDVGNWQPLNIATGFKKGIHFDGKGHTISYFNCKSASSYPSFFGMLNGTVQNVTFDHATIEGNGKMGVVCGYLGTNIAGKDEAPNYLTGNLINVTVKDSSVSGDSYAGGLVGQVNSPATVTGCRVINTTVTSTGERVGGLFGQIGLSNLAIDAAISKCSAENVDVSSTYKNVGGFVGVCYAAVSECTASGKATASYTTSSATEVSCGGFAGHIESANVSRCSSSTVVEATQKNNRSVGGFVGTFKAGKIDRCYATGSVTGPHRNYGGFVGLIQTNISGKTATIENCYCTGSVSAAAYMGGFIGLVDNPKTDGVVVAQDAFVSNCYSAGVVSASGFAAGGFVGFQSCELFHATACAAWNTEVKAVNVGSGNWSSGAFSGVTHPKCTITNCYRNPVMTLTAYWVPDPDYSHPDVSASNPLIKQDGTASAAVSTESGQPGYPQFPYHGKLETGKTLSQLASTTLGWSAEIWDFSGNLPVLK